MTTTKENTSTASTELSNSPGYCNRLIAWCRKNPQKATVVFIVVALIVFVWIHGPFHKINNVYGEPECLGDNASGVNNKVK